MPCPPFEDLSAYADHMLGAHAQEQLHGHVHTCAACQHQLGELQTLQGQLRALPSPALGFDLGARLQDRLRATAPSRPKPRFLWGAWAPAGLAAAALASGAWMGGLLVTGAVVSAPRTAMLRVFDPVPPGGLCAVAELCRPLKGIP